MNTYALFAIDGDFLEFEDPVTAFLRFEGLSPEDADCPAGICLEQGIDVVVRLERDELAAADSAEHT